MASDYTLRQQGQTFVFPSRNIELSTQPADPS